MKIFQTYSATIPNFEESEEYWQKKVIEYLSIKNKQIALKSEAFSKI